jgi:hypothetical protein
MQTLFAKTERNLNNILSVPKPQHLEISLLICIWPVMDMLLMFTNFIEILRACSGEVSSAQSVWCRLFYPNLSTVLPL